MKLQSLQSKIGGTLILVLLVVLGIGFSVTSIQSYNLLNQQSNESIDAVHEVIIDQARSIFASLEVGTRGSLERGEMEVFDELLSGLGSVPGVLEVGLVNPQGVTSYSSREGQVGQRLAKLDIRSTREPLKVEEESSQSVFMAQSHMYEEKCLDCHDDARPGTLAGVLYVEYSLAKLNEEREHNAAILSGATAKSITTNTIIALTCLALTWLVLFFMIRRMVIAPLVKIKDMLTSIGHGHLRNRLGFKQQDMIGETGRALDDLAASLQSEIVDPLKQLANRDLTFSVTPHDQNDELRLAIMNLGDDLGRLIADFQSASEQIDMGSSQVSEAAQQLSDGAAQSAAAVEQISSSMNQIGSQTSASADNARQANQLALTAQKAADNGSERMSDMIQAMGQINEAGQNIGKIIKVIDEIAFQTNLLALNAAVEAARAGQHGKGFAVVAEEVRNLAARSAKAAAETAELIQGSVEKTGNGTRIAESTADALEEIVASIAKVTNLISEIAAASSEQAQGISQVNQGLQQIDQVIQQNTANAEESAATSEELSSQAAELRSQLSLFQLKTAGNHPLRPAQNQPPQRPLPSPSGSGQWGGPQTEPRTASGHRDLLQWSDRLSTGVPLMDKQHQYLVELINRLFTCMRDGGDRMLTAGIVDELVNYTVTHFRAEEDVMKKHNYPDFEAHKKVHENFIEQVGAYAEKLKSGARLAPADVYRFLKNWLVEHIEHQDRDGYGRHIAGN